MADDGRARELAGEAATLAAAAGVTLPDGLRLWALAGGRPLAGHRSASAGPVPLTRSAAARALGDALAARLGVGERRRGAHYTPPALAAVVAGAALGGRRRGEPLVVDPACGGGALLLAAGDRLVADGIDPTRVVAELLFGADVDAVAAAVTEAALALWSGGTPPAPGHVVAADPLLAGRAAWPSAPDAGFDVVVGNPPFQGQLAADTARGAVMRRALRDRFGAAVAGYVDTAALFLLVAVELAAPGGRVGLVQPQSTVAARDGAGVRAATAARARLVDLLVPEGRPFAANVHVCVPVLDVGAPDGAPAWAARLARARGVPEVELPAGPGCVGGAADVVAGFRRHYYGLVGHVGEHPGGGGPSAPLVTSGLVELGACAWGERPARFARQRWWRPVVDVAAVREATPALGPWLDAVRRPKVVVASQTRVVEAAADVAGGWVPSTPLVSVVPRDPQHVHRVAAALCAPPVAAWVAAQAAGTGLSRGVVRVPAGLVRRMPLPSDGDAWDDAAAALAAGDLVRFAAAAVAMYALPGPVAAAVRTWWDEARR